MSPRPYCLGRRQEAADATRERIVAAARDALLARAGIAGFSLEAVAKRAGVARMTVYHHFGSRRGLLEAVLDALARQGGIERMADVFREPDPAVSLGLLVETFARFYGSDRALFRRLHALAALDPALGEALRERAERRRGAARALAERLAARPAKRRGGPEGPEAEELADLLFALTSFETFDTLAGPERRIEEVAGTLRRVVAGVAGVRE